MGVGGSVFAVMVEYSVRWQKSWLRVKCKECVFTNNVDWGTRVNKHFHSDWVAVNFYHEHGFWSVFFSH